jgi:signal transduction histidine kinase
VAAPIQKLDTAQVAREALAEEIARLELLRRLAMGAAHTLNNAFTAILGETLCLADERKHDPLVSEACDLIQGEVERCARLTRSIAARVQRRENALEESNIAALVRGLEPLLRETVSRSVAMSVEVPDLSVLVRGPGEDLELLVLLVAHRLALTPVRGAALHIALGPYDADTAELRFELRVPEETPAVEHADGSWDLLVADAAGVLGSRHGVRIVSSEDDATRCVRLQFEIANLTL